MAGEGPRLRPAWLDDQRPRQGRYVLGPLLGQGGVGEVVEAWDLVLHRTVALKVLKQADPTSLARFMHEARAQSRVVHPCICPIYDVDTHGGTPRIAMQLVRGPTLADAVHGVQANGLAGFEVTGGAGLTEGEVVRILARVADAVHAAHRLNLVHRDLKPSNILLERDGDGGWTPYVCDFGLALDLDEPAITAAHLVNGTPAYMAPEQVRGERDRIGPATDVFALGGTLRFALQKPGPGARDLALVIRRCLEPEPERRYPSAAALAEELWRVNRGEPALARIGDRRPWLRRPLRRWLLAPALAACALLAGTTLVQRRLAAADRERSRWARLYLLEAVHLERTMEWEQILPAHDLRPARERLRTRLAAIEESLRGQGASALGPARFTLGLGRLLLGDPGGARSELEQAWALGFQEPEVAYRLGCALAGVQARTEAERQFAGVAEPSAAAAAGAAMADWFRLGRAPGAGEQAYGEALVAFQRGDFAKAAATAQAGLERHPRHGGLAALVTRSLASQGLLAARAGDPLLAEARLRQAAEAAGSFLAEGPSQPAVLHARLLAGRELAGLWLDRRRSALPWLQRCRQWAQAALRVDPDDPDLQDDWLQIALLEARGLAGQGRDPAPELRAALEFLRLRGREPLTAQLRADRMLLHWRLAEQARRAGADPRPELALALRDPGHTPFLDRDYLPEVLAFQATARPVYGSSPRKNTITDE